MTEDQLIALFLTHWKNGLAALMLAAVYIRLWKFTARQTRLENRQKKILSVLVEIYPDKGAYLYRDEEDNGKP